MRSRISVAQLQSAFAGAFGAELADVRAHGTGHIHDTFAGRYIPEPGTPAAAESSSELLVQRFNTDVFEAPAAVMNNIARVSEHLRAKLARAAVADAQRRVLRVRPTPSGALFWRAADGNTYRAFEFIPGTVSFDLAKSVRQPLEAGRAFGTFVAQLADLPAPALVETIPAFHDTEARLAALRAAFDLDEFGRGAALHAEREQIEQLAPLAGSCARLARANALPLRVIHNDAKLSNLLFDVASEEALCVVDLDTVMPGFAAYDFGDLVRTTGCLVAEDTADLTKVEIRMDFIEALARGYLEGTGALMGQVERETLALGPRLFCYELGMRFLTDHLQGDRYFPIQRAGQNLDRARVQLRLVSELAAREAELRECLLRAGG